MNLLCVAFILVLWLAQCDQLLFAAEFVTPGFYYPKADIFDWAKGKSLYLTNAGLRQQYLLGRELRKRYIEDAKLLSERHDIAHRREIRVRTTSEPQTISSSYAQLMGLYIPGSGDLLNPTEANRAEPPNEFDYSIWTDELEAAALNYTYQTVALEQYGGVADNLLNSMEVCGTVKSLVNSKLESGQEAHQNAFMILADALKVERKSVSNVKIASDLRYALLLSIAEGKPAQTNADEIFTQTVTVDKAYFYSSILDITDKKDVTRIITSPALREVVSILETAVQEHIANNTIVSPLRFVLYSIESPLFLGLLKQLNITSFNIATSLSASALFIELYTNSTSPSKTTADYYVKISCEEKESKLLINDFVGRIRNATYDSAAYGEHCHSFPPEESKVSWVLILAIGGGALVVGLLVLAVCFIRAKCKDGSSDNAKEKEILASLQNRLNIDPAKEDL